MRILFIGLVVTVVLSVPLARIMAGQDQFGIKPGLSQLKVRQKQERMALKAQQKSESQSIKSGHMSKAEWVQMKHQMKRDRRALQEKQKNDLQSMKDQERLLKERPGSFY